MIRLSLAHTPPSVNGMFQNCAGRGRVKTTRYRQWAAAVSWDIKAQHSGKMLSGPFEISMTVGRPSKACDLDNRAKAILDILQSCRVIRDDKLCERITMEWRKGRGADIEIRPFLEAK